MHMKLPRAAVYAMKALTQAGYQAYIVGGSVRDVLLGKQPDDFDITTDATPDEVQALFARDKLSLNGLKHGTVRLIKYATAIEITTFRMDGDYLDGRHPEEVTFTASLYEDAQRRDFTINALCWNEKAGLIDYTDGQEDLKNHLIRCIGVPKVRFEEDALRILRAVRFSAVLDFDIEPATARAAHECAHLLEGIPAERVWMELKKLLSGARFERVMVEFRDVMEVLIPTLKAFDHDGYLLACRRAALTAPAPILRLMALIYDLGAEEIRACAAALKISKLDMKLLTGLAEGRSLPLPMSRPDMRRAFNARGEELMSALVELQCANARALCEMVIQQGDCVSLKQLALGGEDVYRLGVTRRGTGACLEKLLNMVMDGEVENTPEALSAVVRAELDQRAAGGAEKKKRAPRRRAKSAGDDGEEDTPQSRPLAATAPLKGEL